MATEGVFPASKTTYCGSRQQTDSRAKPGSLEDTAGRFFHVVQVKSLHPAERQHPPLNPKGKQAVEGKCAISTVETASHEWPTLKESIQAAVIQGKRLLGPARVSTQEEPRAVCAAMQALTLASKPVDSLYDLAAIPLGPLGEKWTFLSDHLPVEV